MQRINHAIFEHFSHEQAVGLNHDQCVAGFHGNHNLMKIVFFTNANKFKCRLYHPFWGVAITTQDAVWERTMVCSNTHGSAVCFTKENQWCEFLFNTIEFCLVAAVGVVDFFEFLFVCVVTRVNPYFFYDASCDFSCVWCKVDVCY